MPRRDELKFGQAIQSVRAAAIAWAVGVSATALVGCDSEQVQANQALQDAVDQIQLAERGFTEANSEKAVTEYRQEEASKALPNLNQASRAQGNSAALASQLASVIHASKANDAVAQAISAYAQISTLVATLPTYGTSVQMADTSAAVSSIDRKKAIATLQSQIARLKPDLELYQAQVAQLESKLSRLESNIATKRRFASEYLAEYRELTAQSAIAQSKDNAFALEEQAAAAQVASMKQSIDAESIEADAVQARVQLVTAKAMVVEAQGSIARLEQRLALQALRSEKQQRLADQAIANREQAIQTLTENFDEVAGQYAESVDAVLIQAIDDANQAVQLAERGTRTQDRSTRDSARRDLLSARVTAGYVQSQRAYLAAAFAEIVDCAAKGIETSDSSTAALLTENAQGMKAIADESATQAREMLEQAIQLANDINRPDVESINQDASSMLNGLDSAGF